MSLKDDESMPVTMELLKEEVAAYIREKGMNPWYASHMMELIDIGWTRAEKKLMKSD